MNQNDGSDGDDDENAGRVDQGKGPNVTAGLLSKDHHILKATRHSRVVGSNRIKSEKTPEKRHAHKRDDNHV